MTMFRKSPGIAAAILLVAAQISAGCSVSIEAHPPRSVFVESPPPDPLPEYRSGPPAPGMVWQAGYWHYNGTGYVWVPGHWEVPRPGLAWKPPSATYSKSHRAWVYEHGRWVQAGER